jgi:hypothetical protein
MKIATAAQIIGNIKNHTMITSCASRKQSRQAEYDRLTALASGPDLGVWGVRRLDVSQWRRRCNDARELSLMSALRVNSGTAK